MGLVATSTLPSGVAPRWADWLHHPCCLGAGPQRFKAGHQIRSASQVGLVATPPVLSRGSPTLHSWGQNQKWPISGLGGYITPSYLEGPQRLRAGDKITKGPQVGLVAASLAILGPRRFRVGDKIRSGPQEGLVATSPLLSWGGVPNTSAQRTKSEVPHMWPDWLHHPNN